MSGPPGVLIVGAGIGGLTAALSLYEAGIDALVVERAREIRPLGAGINLQPHAVRELTELGLAGELAATAIPTAETLYCDRLGRRLWTEPRGLARGYRWPQYSVHRGELQLLLLAAVRERLGPAAVRTATRFEDVVETPAGIRARLTDRADGTSAEVEAEALVGADGFHSAVRRLVHPHEGGARWTGTRMWRGVTETAPFLTGASMVVANDERGARLIAYPISRRAAERGRSATNWVCLVPVSEPGDLRSEADWNRAGRADDVLPHFAGWRLDWLDVPGLIAGAAQVLEYPMVDRDPLPTWGRGRVTLLGDAAHPMYPVGANGGSQAIVDARVLARELAVAPAVPAALAAYEDARLGPANAIVVANREMDHAERAAVRAGRTGDVAAIAGRYRRASGDVDALNDRPSLSPPARSRPRPEPG